MIVDANDLGQEVLGHSSDIQLTEEELNQLLNLSLCVNAVNAEQKRDI